jgi:tetratricopeptide (TPR) repeat protein
MIKHYYYLDIKKDPGMSIIVAENWVELYPEEVNAHILLAEQYGLLDQRESEVAEYRKILSLDPAQYDFLLRLGEICKYEGKFEEALEYYRQYAGALPNDSKSYIELGNLYTTY